MAPCLCSHNEGMSERATMRVQGGFYFGWTSGSVNIMYTGLVGEWQHCDFSLYLLSFHSVLQYVAAISNDIHAHSQYFVDFDV